MQSSQLLLALIFSCIGMGYFIYGKKQKVIIPFLSGIALMIYPFFTHQTIFIIIFGLLLSIIPYFIRL